MPALFTESTSRALSRSAQCLAWATIALFGVACMLPAIETMGDDPGWFCLLYGWMAIVVGWPPWIANFTLFAGLMCLVNGRHRAALAFGYVSIGLSLSAPVLLNHLRIGYFFWQASMIAFCFAAWIERRRKSGECLEAV